MATKKKLLQAAAGQAGGAGLNILDVFSTYLYTGTASAQTITNNIDLSGEGGITWIKNRENSSADHSIYTTDIGNDKLLATNKNDALNTVSNSLSFTSSGFSLSATNIGYWNTNKSGEDYVSWTFRKAPKFFTCLTYTGDGTAGRTISHNLGSTPGCIIIKGTSSNYEWPVYHRGVDSTAPEDYYLWLNYASARTDNVGYWNDTAPTSTQFTLGNNGNVNASGQTYVAYLFAHNDGDADFGSTADQDIIKCGSFNTPSSGDLDVSLGFEPQFILFKRSDASENWGMRDVMRGMSYGPNGDARLWPNLNSQEFDGDAFNPTPTGFTVQGGTDLSYSANYIYIAIRRGPMAVPESATDVFATAFDAGATNPTYVSGFVADMGIQTNTTGYNKRVSSRLTSGSFLEADNTAAESTSGSYTWDFMNGWNNQSINSTWLSWMWKRAPSFCDVVAYTGNGTAGRTVSHNLGVAPEMMWVKNRNNTTDWVVYHKAIGNSKIINLNDSYFAYTQANFNNTDPTSSVFTLGSIAGTNGSNQTFIAYLFASLDGISKVGSFTTTGSDVNVDCGFSSGGARFVLWKRTDSAGSWNLMDSERGIVAGNDPFLNLNQTTAENNTVDLIDPYSSGFTVAGGGLSSGGTYIFYAIA